MQVSAVSFVALLIGVSFFPSSSGSPLPDQNAVLPNEAAPLEAEDDPARIKRYEGYGLKLTKVQRVQPTSNVHPDAALFVAADGTAQMSTTSAGGAQAERGSGAIVSQAGGMRRTQQAEVAPIGEETSSQRGGTFGTAPSDGAPGHFGVMQSGQDMSDTSRVAGNGMPLTATSGIATATPLESGHFASSGVNPSLRAGIETSTVVDSTTSENDLRSAPGIGLSTVGGSAEVPNVSAMMAGREGVSQSERQGAQMGYGPAGNTVGPAVAQSKLAYGGRESILPAAVARVDENGVPRAVQRSWASEGISGNTRNGIFVQQNDMGRYVAGSRD